MSPLKTVSLANTVPRACANDPVPPMIAKVTPFADETQTARSEAVFLVADLSPNLAWAVGLNSHDGPGIERWNGSSWNLAATRSRR